MTLTGAMIEDAALKWFGELGYAVEHVPHLVPRSFFGRHTHQSLTLASFRKTMLPQLKRGESSRQDKWNAGAGCKTAMSR
jgi:hypothetical protein